MLPGLVVTGLEIWGDAGDPGWWQVQRVGALTRRAGGWAQHGDSVSRAFLWASSAGAGAGGPAGVPLECCGVPLDSVKAGPAPPDRPPVAVALHRGPRLAERVATPPTAGPVQPGLQGSGRWVVPLKGRSCSGDPGSLRRGLPLETGAAGVLPEEREGGLSVRRPAARPADAGASPRGQAKPAARQALASGPRRGVTVASGHRRGVKGGFREVRGPSFPVDALRKLGAAKPRDPYPCALLEVTGAGGSL